jgi:magnesium-transporting ATPase (P-type)
LLTASLISGLLGETLNATLIALLVVLSVALDSVQVYRSEHAARQLSGLVALTALADSKVGIKILTGDGELVARTICSQVGLRTDQVVLRSDVESMNDHALGVVAEHVVCSRAYRRRKRTA